MKINREKLRRLKRMPVSAKRESLKQLAINNNLSEMYIDIMIFTDEQIELAFAEVLHYALGEINNGSK